MKMISEYLETALRFERRAAAEPASGLKTSFEKQAIAYRKLAAQCAKKISIPELPVSIGRNGEQHRRKPVGALVEIGLRAKGK
jgi:hypothetical protein